MVYQISCRLLSYVYWLSQVEGGSASDSAVVKPCIAALGCLTLEFFKHLSVHVQVTLLLIGIIM